MLTLKKKGIVCCHLTAIQRMCFISDGILTIHKRVSISPLAATAFILILIMLSGVPKCSIRKYHIMPKWDSLFYVTQLMREESEEWAAQLLGMMTPEEIALASQIHINRCSPVFLTSYFNLKNNRKFCSFAFLSCIGSSFEP